MATIDPKILQAALDALIAGDDKKCAEILKSIVVGGDSADPDAATEDAPPPAGDGGADEGTEGAAEPDPKKKPGSGGAAPAMMAAARMALAIAGKTDPGEAMAELARRSAIATDLETREAKLRADQVTLEAGERRKLVGDLVKLGAEIPATAWADDKGTVPADEYASMPIARLRDKVAKRLAAAPGGKMPSATLAAAKPPTTAAAAGDKVVAGIAMTAIEVASVTKKAKANGVDPEMALEKYATQLRRQGRGAAAEG